MIGDTRAVLKLLASLAAGLAHAHGRQILHLDIKPANILLADSGEPMLLDFNLSHDTAVQERELIGGTVQYMAPEQLVDVRTGGQGGVDARTDLYSLGALAFEMLTGSVPFPVSTRLLTRFDDIMASRMKGCPPLQGRHLDITPAVESILAKLLTAEARGSVSIGF